jgi:uncharacterized OB-fold protein
VHGFTIQETGVPAGFAAPLVFAIVKVNGLRIFTPVVTREPAALAVGARVRLAPVRVADDPRGAARYLVAFEPA